MQHKIEACSLKIRLVGGVIYRCCYKWRKINWYIRLIVRRRQELDAIWMFRVLKGKSGIYPISSPNLLKCQFPANFWANPFPISSFLIFISSPREPNPIFPMKNRQIRLSSQFTPRGPSTINGPSLESIILCFLLFDFPFFVAGFFLTNSVFLMPGIPNVMARNITWHRTISVPWFNTWVKWVKSLYSEF